MDAIEIRAPERTKYALHFGAPSRPLLGFYHPPASRSRGAGVVLVSPLGTDQTRSDRTYRHLAERLAAAGFACVRFDPYATGDSGGDVSEPGLVEQWIADVGRAIDLLRERSGVSAVSLAGVRLGATVAMAAAARRDDVDGLVLWGPCVSGSAYVTEVAKLHKLYLRIEPNLATAGPPREGGEEALGLFLPDALIEDLQAVDLMRVDRRPARRAMIVDGGALQGGGVLPGRDALVKHLRDLGVQTDLQQHPGHKFLITVSHRSAVPKTAIDAVVRWLEDVHPPAESRPRALSVASDAEPLAPAGERLVVFGDDHPLFGILTPAAEGAGRAERPAIVIANAGCVNRAGPHRLFTTLARRWAALGFDVLRVDLAGIGDSPAAPGTEENLTYPASGLADLRAAAAVFGGRKVIVAGLCSGGDFAFQMAAQDPVAGVWMLNPRTFCVLDLVAVESGEGAVPLESVEDVPRVLGRVADRGAEVLLLVSRNDPGVAYVDAHATEAMRRLDGRAHFVRVDLDGSDHPFTPLEAQDKLGELLTEHLVARFG